MSIDPRDERFMEFAVASGALDGAVAHELWEARRAAEPGEPIEQFSVRMGFLTPQSLQQVVAYARSAGQGGTGTVADDSKTQVVPHTPQTLSPTDETLREEHQPKPKTARLGTRFGPYEVIGELGRGGMGAVYKARKDGSTEVVALKILLDEKDPPPATVRRFEREIRAGREIDHPNVVRVVDAGEIEKRLFFAMEYVPGQSFDKVLEELPLRQRIELFEKICRAVHHAHVRGFIHRDLKPQNVIITDSSFEPKVADFGLAKSLDKQSSLTKTGAILGTIAYMSPEQAEGGKMHVLDARTDVYSLGAILYQLICGTVPFKAATQFGVIGLILTQDPEPPVAVSASCPPALSAIALKALEKEPTKRFQTAAELADEVARWLHGTKVTTHAPRLTDRFAKGLRRRALPIAAVLFTAFVAVMTLAFLQWRHEKEHRALLDETAAKVDAIFAELAKPGDTSALADRLDALDAAMKTLPELAERHRAIEGLALVARSLEKEKDPAAARPLLEAALQKGGARWDVRRAYVNVLERLGEPGLAAACIEGAAPIGSDAMARLGEERVALGDLIGARAAFEQAGPPASAALARTLALLGDPKGVDVARALPASDEQAILLQEARVATSDAGYAIDALRLIERSKATPELQLRIGRAVLALERPDEALASFARAAKSPALARERLLLEAEALLLVGDAKKACARLDEAARLAPARSWLRASALLRKARIQEIAGQEPSREALAERPDDPAVRAFFAGEDAALLEKVAPALGTRPEAVRAWCALARLRAKKGDAEGSRAARAKAIAIDPTDEEALAAPETARLGFAHGRGDGSRLLALSNIAWRNGQLFEHDPDKARAATLLGFAERAAPWAGAPLIERARRLLLEGPNAIPAARAMLERALALVPDDPLGAVLLGSLSEGEKAEKLADRALAVEPENARALGIRGRARLEQKRPKEALADIERSLRIDHRDATVWDAKVAALQALGQPSADAETEARDRHQALAVAYRACNAKDFYRALDYAPDEPNVVLRAVDDLFQGNIALDDPFLLYTRAIARQPGMLLNGVWNRTAIESIQSGLAERYEGPDADADSLFEAFVLRAITIVKNRDLKPETLAKPRLDLERCLAKDPGAIVAISGRGFILALERQTALAAEDLVTPINYAPDALVFRFADALVKAQQQKDYKLELDMLVQPTAEREALYKWALELTKVGK